MTVFRKKEHPVFCHHQCPKGTERGTLTAQCAPVRIYFRHTDRYRRHGRPVFRKEEVKVRLLNVAVNQGNLF
jgi:hypothetical protein